MRKAIAAAVLACVAAGSGLAWVRPGQPAPRYTIETFDKQKVTSDQLAGQVVLINFWATWCGPCKAELPELDAYNRKHAQEGLRIYAVTTEGSVPDYKLKPLQALLSFPLAHHISGNGLAEMEGVPTSFVIDRQGIVRYAHSGAFDEASLDEVVGPLLAQPAHGAIVTAAAATHGP